MRTRNAAGLARPTLLVLALLSFVFQAQLASAAVVDSAEDLMYALTQAGRSQYAQRDYASARSSFSRAIELIEAQSGPVSILLLDPLEGLADTLIAMQQPQAAVETLRRAVTVVRRAAGLYDLRQYALLVRLADLQSLTGDVDAAAESLTYVKRVSESTHGRRSVRHALALTQIADWQCRVGRFVEGRQHFRQSIVVLDARNSDEALLSALLGLAQCCLQELAGEGIATTPGTLERYRGPVLRSARMSPDSPAFGFHVNRFLRAEGEAALRKAVQVVETRSVGVQLHLFVLLQTGDWFQIKDHRVAARTYYAKAQALAERQPAGPDLPLSAPLQVLYPIPPLALRNRNLPEAATLERFVEMEFVVRADGKIDGERVTGRELGKTAVDEMLSALRAARFRPRVVNGRAVDTAGVRFRQAFREGK